MAKGSTTLQNFLLASEEFNRAYLIGVTLTNGTNINVLFGTNLTAITYNSVNYYSTLYGVWELGDMTFEAAFRPTSNSFKLTALFQTADGNPIFYPGTSTTMLQTINGSLWTGATVNIQTLYWPIDLRPNSLFTFVYGSNTYTNVSGISMGTIPLQIGQIGNVNSTGRSKIEFEVYDLLYILNRPVPPHELQSPCRFTLFDEGCTLLASNFTSTATPLLASSTLALNLNVAAHATSHLYAKGDLITVSSVVYFANNAGTSSGSAPSFNAPRAAHTTDGGVTWISMGVNSQGLNGYSQGWGVFASGLNVGVKFAIKLDEGNGVLQLIAPLPFPVSVGDTVKILPGCDKTLATCTNVYNNLINFAGTPYVPNPEIAGASGG